MTSTFPERPKIKKQTASRALHRWQCGMASVHDNLITPAASVQPPVPVFLFIPDCDTIYAICRRAERDSLSRKRKEPDMRSRWKFKRQICFKDWRQIKKELPPGRVIMAVYTFRTRNAITILVRGEDWSENFDGGRKSRAALAQRI